MTCPFCNVNVDLLFDRAVVIDDAFPVTKGHRLVIPREHLTWQQLNHIAPCDDVSDVLRDMMCLVVREQFSMRRNDSTIIGFNIGWNDGVAAGQTVEHAHIHVIPRRAGDMEDPRGGVRHVIPSKARYW